MLRKLFRDGAGQWRELTVMTPTIEKDDLRESILRWMVCLYLFLLLMILLVTVIVLYRTMRPLYAPAAVARRLHRGGRGTPAGRRDLRHGVPKLNDAARRYAERAESSFERQKQFIGNASHEMQTPLAVCRNRLEMLVDDAHALTGEQLGEIAKVQRTLDYLVRLNRSLLLLSKIDNGQFPRGRRGRRERTGARTAEDMEEIYAYRSMRFALVDEGPLTARMNPSLAGSVVANLLKKRIRSRRRGRRGDGARRSASLHGLQQRCGRSARRRAYLRPVLSGNEEGGFYGAGPCRGRRSLPSLRVEGVPILIRRGGIASRSISRREKKMQEIRFFRFVSVSGRNFAVRNSIKTLRL